jgi:hypothetical protein
MSKPIERENMPVSIETGAIAYAYARFGFTVKQLVHVPRIQTTYKVAAFDQQKGNLFYKTKNRPFHTIEYKITTWHIGGQDIKAAFIASNNLVVIADED